MSVDDPGPELALVVGAARSGTTLLRLLLDAHPEIGSPSEAGLPSLMSHMARAWGMVHADEGGPGVLATDPGQADPDAPDPPGETTTDGEVDQKLQPAPVVPEEARDWIRVAMQTAMRSYLTPARKRLYVDKSLDSVFHLEIARQAFPELRCVLAFRHVMDTIASGIEASPWGFQAYGYAPYVQATPGNTVLALARYWLDHVSVALHWEQRHPEACIRVRYEDLVAQPEDTVRSVQAFLGVREEQSVVQGAFEREPARGPGDYKVLHTRAVHNSSVGHGKRIPVEMLPPPVLIAVNEKLAALGYPILDHSWNAAERAVEAPADTIWATQLRNLMARLTPPPKDTGIGPLALVSEDHRELRWVIDPEARTVQQGDGDVEAVLTGTTEDLVLMLSSQENLGVLVRSGRIRHVSADEDDGTHRTSPWELDSIVAALRAGLEGR